MDKDAQRRKTVRRGHAVLLTVPAEMMAELHTEARWRTLPVATAARLMVKERLEQIREGKR